MRQPLGYEEWVKKLVSNLASYFNLAGWTLQVEFPAEEKGTTYAENDINSTYHGSTLRVYPPAKRDFESGDIDRFVMAIVHELVHLFIDPFHDAILPFLSAYTTPAFHEILEQQTQKLTMVFLKTLPKSLIPPR